MLSRLYEYASAHGRVRSPISQSHTKHCRVCRCNDCASPNDHTSASIHGNASTHRAFRQCELKPQVADVSQQRCNRCLGVLVVKGESGFDLIVNVFLFRGSIREQGLPPERFREPFDRVVRIVIAGKPHRFSRQILAVDDRSENAARQSTFAIHGDFQLADRGAGTPYRRHLPRRGALRASPDPAFSAAINLGCASVTVTSQGGVQ